MKLNPERLIEARGLAGISQRELSERCGVSKTSIVNYETALLSPRKTTVYRLAKALEVSVDFLCGTENLKEDIILEALDVDNWPDIDMSSIYEDMEARGFNSVKDWARDAIRAGMKQAEIEKRKQQQKGTDEE